MAKIAFDHVTKRFDAETVAVDELTVTAEEGEFLILVGPSGCGKTTALRMAAGLEEVTSGDISIADRRVNDLPPAQRDIAMVFQNYALYPHMSVRQNIGFPLARQRVKKPELTERVRAVATLLDIESLLDRRPAQLSGGERQRVAIGRALVRRPRAFLMDEPLSNLDAKLRVQMRTELLALHKKLGITTLYVTHDQTEAMTLGDRVVVMNHGVVQQVDKPEQLYRHPGNLFVATFIGSPSMNLVAGATADGRLRLGTRSVSMPELRAHNDVIVGFRPEDATLAAPDSTTSFPGEVEITEMLGPEILAHIRLDGVAREGSPSDLVLVRVNPDSPMRAGDRVGLELNPARLRIFDPGSTEALPH
jgi:multiple sugar transport system ATP-binding protein